eukprot:CAMPEP_0197232626 /NCGR_PEP_ID=MMETSP1429-20130617/881_1 /TAXON_ID=49237 /ORGANISM="Chaetoceros  sp., Strain UNC1202" /LENGTH=66 /DNA_ID=CAMNT_0042690705 /DNA_START=113 /DNA_END=313 /DNA_ORIENTATION=-
MDSVGKNISSGRDDLNNVASECCSDAQCAGFNSDGYEKYEIRARRKWKTKWKDDPSKGMYVKKATK